MQIRFRAVAVVVVLLLAAGSVSAGQFGIASRSPVAPAASGAQLAALWRSAQVELDRVSCSDPQCSDAVAQVQAVGKEYEAGGDPTTKAGGDPAKLFARLGVAVSALNALLQREAGSSGQQAFAMGSVLYSRAAVAHLPPSGPLGPSPDAHLPSLGPSGEANYGSEQCSQNCDRIMVAVMAACSIVPPPFDVLCVGGAIGAYMSCLDSCSQSSNGNAVARPSPDAVRSVALLCGGGLCDFSSGGAVPITPSASQLAAAVPSLAGRFGRTELREGLALSAIVFGGQ